MTSKLLTALALLLIGNMAITCKAQVLTTDFIDAYFVTAPKVVIDTTKTEDKAFAEDPMLRSYFSFGVNTNMLYVWVFYWGSSTLSVVKRTLNTTTLEPTTDDIIIKTNVSEFPRKVGFGVGYIGMPYKKKVDDVDQLFFFVLPAEATADMSPLEIQLTSNSHSPIEYYHIATLFQNDVFYIVFSEYFKEKKTTTFATYLQGVRAKDGSLVYPDPILVIPFNQSVDTPWIRAGFDRVVDASSIIITWKDRSREFVVQSTFNITDGKVTEPVTLTKDTDGWNWPHRVVASSTSSGVFVENTPFQNRQKSSLKLILNGDPDKTKDFDLQPPENYTLSHLSTTDRTNGFVAVGIYQLKNLKLMFRYFDDKGSPLGPQKEIASTTSRIEYPISETLEDDFHFPVDANGAVWFGHCDFDATTKKIDKCYVGKLIA